MEKLKSKLNNLALINKGRANTILINLIPVEPLSHRSVALSSTKCREIKCVYPVEGGVGAITGVSRIKFVLKYIKKKEGRKNVRNERGEKGNDPAWRRKESRREPPALFPAITRPRKPEDIIISPVFLVREFERRQRRARRIYFIKTIFQPSSPPPRNFPSPLRGR